jgi:2-aminoethylphosphonate-pyruvate transaminase
MLKDWGSWDHDFNTLTASVCSDLLAIAHGTAEHVCVPLQGSGTYAVEAAIANLLPRDGKLLVLVNGAYGKRMALIAHTLGRAFSVYETEDDQLTGTGNGPAAARRPGHHPCRPDSLRNQYRHPQPAE